MNTGIDPFDPLAQGVYARLLAATERIAQSGFVDVGWWALSGNRQDLLLRLREPAASTCSGLYAFTVDGALAYIGKTRQPLRQHLQVDKCSHFDAPSEASTEREYHANIVQALRRGQKVRVWALVGAQAVRSPGHVTEQPTDLGDALIDTLAPPWNRPKQAPLSPTSASSATTKPIPPLPRAAARHLTSEASMTPTINDLLDFARSQRGNTLHTLKRHTPFRVEVIGHAFEFLPASGQVRREGTGSATALLNAFSKRNSWQTSDYQELTFNASYLLALMKGWQDRVRSR